MSAKTKFASAAMLLAAISVTRSFELEPITEHVGAYVTKLNEAYVSRTSWRFLYYYDITDFYNNVDMYKNSLIELDKICNKLQKMNESRQCIGLIKKHKSFLEDMNIDLQYLNMIQKTSNQSPQLSSKRRKRQAPLSFVTTYGFKPLFGVMGEEDAKELSSKIDALAESQNTHHTLFENNLSIMSSIIETANDSMSNFRQGMEEMRTFIEETVEQVQSFQTQSELQITFTYISSLVTNIKIEYLKAISIIKKIIKNKLIGEYAEFLTYQRLIKDIQSIKQSFDTTKLELITDPLELQNSLQVTGGIANKKLLVEIEIPLVERKSYKLKRIILLPIRHGAEVFMFDVTSLNYLVQNEQQLYIPLETEDQSQCREISRAKLICFPQRETYLADDMNCISNILFEKAFRIEQTCSLKDYRNDDYIIDLGNNLQFVSPNGTLVIREKCIGGKSTRHEISQPGFLRQNVNCEISTDKMIIFPKYSRTKTGIQHLPVPNRTLNLKLEDFSHSNTKGRIELPPPKTVFRNFQSKFAKLHDQAQRGEKMLKKLDTISPINQHLLRNTVIGITAILILVLIALCVIKSCC